jgi:hypothetical protein
MCALLGQITALESGRRALQEQNLFSSLLPEPRVHVKARAIKSVIRAGSSRFGLARPALCKSYASHLQSSSAASVLPFYPSARRPGVESSETILLRRLILRLINQISLLSSLADGRTPHPPCAGLLEKRLYVSPQPP